MKYLFLSLLLIGCSKVDSNGITDTIISKDFQSREGACSNLRKNFRITCIKAGYKSYEELEAYSQEKVNFGKPIGLYRCVGVAQCHNRK